MTILNANIAVAGSGPEHGEMIRGFMRGMAAGTWDARRLKEQVKFRWRSYRWHMAGAYRRGTPKSWAAEERAMVRRTVRELREVRREAVAHLRAAS